MSADANQCGTTACSQERVSQFISQAEPWLTIASGWALLRMGVKQPSFFGGVIAATGSCILFKGVNAVISRLPQSEPLEIGGSAECAADDFADSVVDEASWESFPASDPPAYGSPSMTRVARYPR